MELFKSLGELDERVLRVLIFLPACPMNGMNDVAEDSHVFDELYRLYVCDSESHSLTHDSSEEHIPVSGGGKL